MPGGEAASYTHDKVIFYKTPVVQSPLMTLYPYLRELCQQRGRCDGGIFFRLGKKEEKEKRRK